MFCAHEFEKISNNKYYQHNILILVFSQIISQDNSQISFLFDGLDSSNGTYASLAFISGVGNKNPSMGCGITAFLKSAKTPFFGFVLHIVSILLSLKKNTATFWRRVHLRASSGELHTSSSGAHSFSLRHTSKTNMRIRENIVGAHLGCRLESNPASFILVVCRHVSVRYVH